MATRRAIIVGDRTTHGGIVLTGSSTMLVEGKQIAKIGDLVHCPKCNGTFPIIEGSNQAFFFGTGVALEGMKVACGAVLIGSQSLMYVDDEASGSGKSHISLNVLENKKEIEKKIIDLYWSYGENKIRLDQEKSRYYTDLNLHIVTENYHDGELVSVECEYEGEMGISKKTVSAVVNNNAACILQVFKNERIIV